MPSDAQRILEAGGWTLVTLAAIAILVVLVHQIRLRWFENADLSESREQLLLECNEMRRKGVLTDEEFRSINSRLSASTGGNQFSTSEHGVSETGPLRKPSETKPVD